MQLLPQVRHAWLVQEITHDVIRQAHANGISQLCPRGNAVTADAVALARGSGFTVRAWGTKTPEVIARLFMIESPWKS
jgi:hypothetical protein